MCQIKQLGSDIYRKYDLEQSRTVCQSDMSEGIFDALVDVHSIAGDLDECEHIAEALRVLPRKLEPIASSYLSGVAVIRIAAARGVHVGTIYRNLHAIFAIWIDWEQR